MRVVIRIPRMACWPKGYPAHGQGFDNHSESPRQAWPNRVHLRYGLVILLGLLSTPPFGNAVTTIGHRLITTAWQGTHTLLIKRLRGRTSAVPSGAAFSCRESASIEDSRRGNLGRGEIFGRQKAAPFGRRTPKATLRCTRFPQSRSSRRQRLWSAVPSGTALSARESATLKISSR